MKKFNQIIFIVILLIFTNCEQQSNQNSENLKLNTNTDAQIESIFELMQVLYPEKYASLYPKKELLQKEFYTTIDLKTTSINNNFIQRVPCYDETKPDTILSIINFEEDNGFAIILNGEHDQIIALTDNGNLTIDDLTKKYTLEEFTTNPKATISTIINNSLGITPNLSSDIIGNAWTGPWETTIQVNPLVKVKFDQNSPYNKYCYNSNGQICPAGCVAIALIQIMSANKYPNTIGGITYNWNTIINEYKTNTYTQDILASWIKTIGDDCDMEYTTSGSSSNITKAKNCLDLYPRYTNLNIVDFPTENIVSSILENETPMYFRGSRTDSVNYNPAKTFGHAWVVDGCIYQKRLVKISDLNGNLLKQYYQTRNYVHCNWGWGGSCDGYYSFNVFDLRNGATIQDGSNSSGTQNRYYNLNIRAITYNLQ